jgi:hypothetical protein
MNLFGINIMSSMVNDLFLKVIEIQQKTLEKIDTKADLE